MCGSLSGLAHDDVVVGRREKVPLFDLPWERPWTLVDLREDYDAELLQKFYNTCVMHKDGEFIVNHCNTSLLPRHHHSTKTSP